MNLVKDLCTLAAVALLALPLAAQEAPEMSAEDAAMMAAYQKAGAPGEEHAMLAKAEGRWNMVIKSWMDPSAPPMVSEGVSDGKMILGGRVLQQTTESSMMGMAFEGLGMTGYDNVTGKYWATWADSMSTGFFLSHGTYDEATNSITYHGEYADPMSGEMIKVRAVTRVESDDRRFFDWYEMRGGNELRTMEITYTRQ